MDSTHLSTRLSAVAEFVPLGARLADIGSDHAYLPANLLRNHKITYAVVGEVAKGPLDNAAHELRKHDLLATSSVRLADGLAAVKDSDNIDTITIAGMGGILISDILAAGTQRGQSFETLIIQPNTDESVVRRWLNTHNYAIIDEEIVQEDNHFYEIILAKPGNQILSEIDIAFGPYLRIKKTSVFVAKWQKERDRIMLIFKNLESAGKTNTENYKNWQAWYNQINEVIS